MTGIAIAIVLAVVGACFYSGGAWLQHNAVSTVQSERRLGWAGLFELLRTPRWLLGLAVVGAGIVAHVAALALAPLSIVQPIGALALPVTVLLHFRSEAAKIRPSVMLAVGTAVAGLVVFVVFTAGVVTPTPVGPHAELIAGALTAGALALVAVAYFGTRGKTRGVVLAIGAGIAYGYVSLQMRAVFLRLASDGVTGGLLLSLLPLVVALVLGVTLLQLAYSCGPPDVAVACLTVVDPLVAVGFGIGLLGEAARSSGWTIAGQVAGGVLAMTGVVILTRHGVVPRAVKRAERLSSR